MLLRRVIKHVREQNWLAVGIDFLIVVTGGRASPRLRSRSCSP